MKTRISLMILSTILLAATAWPVVAKDVKNANDITKQQLKEVQGYLQPKQRLTRQNYRKIMLERFEEFLVKAKDLRAAHAAVPASAPNMAKLEQQRLTIAEQMVRAKRDDASVKQLQEIAQGILDSKPANDLKIKADATLTNSKALPMGKPAANAEKLIKAFLKRNKPLDEAKATLAAAQMAQQAKLQPLLKSLLDTIEAKFSKNPAALKLLLDNGRPVPFVGKVKTIDGKDLDLSKDLKGKVVVVDFWATWCGPCRMIMPHLKKVWQKHKDSGKVVVLGISLDSPRRETPEQNKAKVKKFIADNGYHWLHTYGPANQKVAGSYGVRGIPAVFVIGKDGKILTTKARGQEEKWIQKALQAK